MKKLKTYIKEGLFNSDSTDNLSNSLSHNVIKGTFRISSKTTPITIYGSYKLKDIVQIFVNNHDITDLIIKENLEFGIVAPIYLESELGISINDKLVVTYCFPDDLDTIEQIFRDCKNLIDVDLSHLDISKLENCEDAFSYTEIKEIKFPKGVNNESISFISMFLGCESLEMVDMSESVFNNISNMSYMFRDCIKLKTIKFDGLCGNNSKATCEEHIGMFIDCGSIEKIDLTGLKMENSVDMRYMFANCKNLKEVIMPYFGPGERCESIFDKCQSLRTVNISGYYNNPKVIRHEYDYTMEYLRSKYNNIDFVK